MFEGKEQREDKDEVAWTRIEPPYYWDAIGDFIIGDRHLVDGTRQHMILGEVEVGRVVRSTDRFGIVCA